MKFLVALCLVASAMAIEDTPEVVAAKADFAAAFAAAEAGEHIALRPAPVATAYLDDVAAVAEAKAAFKAAFDAAPPAPVASAYLADDAAVAEAKAAFMKAFEAAEKGEHAALAPKPVEALPVPEPVAPVAPVAPVVTYAGLPYFNGYYGAYPYHYGYAGYPYAHAGYAYAGYPYHYPYVYTVAAPKKE